MPEEPKRPTLRNLVKGLRASLPECGRIKIGIKGEWRKSSQGAEFQLPKKLDHFVITTMVRDDKSGNFIEDRALTKLLCADSRNVEVTKQQNGPDLVKLVRIPIYLLFDDIEKNIGCRMMRVVNNKVVCVGDGENAEEKTDKGINYRSCPCEKSAPEYTGKDKCRINTTLMVVIRGAEQLGGVWSYRTTSRKATENLLSSLALVMNTTGGPLAWIPLELRLVPINTITPTDGKPTKVYRVQVIFPDKPDVLRETGIKLLQAKTEHQRSIALLEVVNDRYLRRDLTQDEIEEFYPEAAEEAGPTERSTPATEKSDGKTTEKPSEKPSEQATPRTGRRGRPKKDTAESAQTTAATPPSEDNPPSRGEENATFQEITKETGQEPPEEDEERDEEPGHAGDGDPTGQGEAQADDDDVSSWWGNNQ
jgi:hypothetical protein